jgi:hypothetical protein
MIEYTMRIKSRPGEPDILRKIFLSHKEALAFLHSEAETKERRERDALICVREGHGRLDCQCYVIDKRTYEHCWCDRCGLTVSDKELKT